MKGIERFKAHAKAKATKALKIFDEQKRDTRFRRAIGLLKRNRLLEVNRPYPYLGKADMQDMLWAGQIEPRIYELLPAIVLKRPNLIRINPLPDDLKRIIADIRKGQPKLSFRGVPPQQYMQWLTYVGRKNKLPSVLKTFRLQQEDLKLLRSIADAEKISETEAIRRGLKLLAEKNLASKRSGSPSKKGATKK